MKHSLTCLVALAVLSLGFLSGCAAVPPPSAVQLITDACNVDAVARPDAQVLVTVVGTPVEANVLKSLEGDIDIVCANPSASVQANGQAILKANSAKIAQLLANLSARQKGNPEPFPNVLTSP